MNVTIHCNSAIPWHKQRLAQMKAGLEQIGFFVSVTNSSVRINDNPAVLFGTSGFKAVEAVEGDWLLVDRACFLDPDYVRLGWNGRDRKANYCLPEVSEWDRWESFDIEPEAHAEGADRVVLCGDYDSIPEIPDYLKPTHFRPHPAKGAATYPLPVVHDFENACQAIVGRSSVAFEALRRGMVVTVTDPNAMAYLPLWQIAYTQWSWFEIEQGEPIRHLFEWLR